MIKVVYSIAPGDSYIHITGHEQGPGRGAALICCAVSTIFQLAVLGLIHLAEQSKEIKIVCLGDSAFLQKGKLL